MVRVTAFLVVVTAMFAVSVPSAFAHDPVFVTEEQIDVASGPYFPDGTISWAVYGTLGSQDTRAFSFSHADGDTLNISLLIPDVAPESSLEIGELPMLTLTSPAGVPVELTPIIRVPFDEPFSGTSYIRLAEFEAPAEAGVYEAVVTGSQPARFTIAFGRTESFGTPADRVENRDEPRLLSSWYATPPPAALVTTTVVTTSPAVDGATPSEADDVEESATTASVVAVEGEAASGAWLLAGAILVAAVGLALAFKFGRRQGESD